MDNSTRADLAWPAESVAYELELGVIAAFFEPRARERMGSIVRRGTDEVIATPRTRRWSLDQCNNQEKAYLGVNIENLVRSEYQLDEGRAGMDFNVSGIDVDCKWSRNFGGWQIPNEAVGHICLLVYGDDITGEMAVGLVRIHQEILVGGNRDQKRTIQRPEGMNQVRWIVKPQTPVPENFLMSLRKVDRDAILAPRAGDERARELFRRCEGIVIHRHVIESIGQQVDEGRRFRGETRQRLLQEGFEVLNGHWKAHQKRALELGGIALSGSEQWVCLRSDGSTPERRTQLDSIRFAEAVAFKRAFKKELGTKRTARKRQQREARAESIQLALELQDELDDAVDSQIALTDAEIVAAQTIHQATR